LSIGDLRSQYPRRDVFEHLAHEVDVEHPLRVIVDQLEPSARRICRLHAREYRQRAFGDDEFLRRFWALGWAASGSTARLPNGSLPAAFFRRNMHMSATIGIARRSASQLKMKPPNRPADADSFRKTERSRIRRRHKNARYDRETVHAILDSGLICHVGFVVDGQPFVTPTAYWRMAEAIYFHGSSASRTLKQVGRAIPVCVTVSHLDGIVHARSGFNSCMNYRSVMMFGKAFLVTDAEEKRAALYGLLDRLAPGRSKETKPISWQELKATGVMRLALEEVSAKVRAGDVGDDEADRALDYWAGVVPVRTVLDSPIDDPELRPGIARPENITQIRLGR